VKCFRDPPLLGSVLVDCVGGLVGGLSSATLESGRMLQALRSTSVRSVL